MAPCCLLLLLLVVAPRCSRGQTPFPLRRRPRPPSVSEHASRTPRLAARTLSGWGFQGEEACFFFFDSGKNRKVGWCTYTLQQVMLDTVHQEKTKQASPPGDKHSKKCTVVAALLRLPGSTRRIEGRLVFGLSLIVQLRLRHHPRRRHHTERGNSLRAITSSHIYHITSYIICYLMTNCCDTAYSITSSVYYTAVQHNNTGTYRMYHDMYYCYTCVCRFPKDSNATLHTNTQTHVHHHTAAVRVTIIGGFM